MGSSVKMWSYLLPPLCYYLRCEILSRSRRKTKRACSAVKLYLFCFLCPRCSSFPRPSKKSLFLTFKICAAFVRWSRPAPRLNNQAPPSACLLMSDWETPGTPRHGPTLAETGLLSACKDFMQCWKARDILLKCNETLTKGPSNGLFSLCLPLWGQISLKPFNGEMRAAVRLELYGS